MGAHSDIGGGYAEGGLSNVALMWMIDQARSQGIEFEDEKIKSNGWNVVTNPVVHDSRVGKGFKEWLWPDGGDRELAYRDGSRVKQESAVMHYGVTGTDKARESINYFSKARGADGTIVGWVDVKKYEAWLSGISVTFQPSPAVPEGCKLK